MKEEPTTSGARSSETDTMKAKIQARIQALMAQAEEQGRLVDELAANPNTSERELTIAKQAFEDFQEQTRRELVEIGCDAGDCLLALDEKRKALAPLLGPSDLRKTAESFRVACSIWRSMNPDEITPEVFSELSRSMISSFESVAVMLDHCAHRIEELTG